MKIRWKALVLCLLLPLGTGALAALLSRGSMDTFARLVQPPLSPPGWLFPVVWTALYTLMGVASYLVFTAGAPEAAVRSALRVYSVQLFFNFFWTIFFFNLEWFLFAFFWLVLLWALIITTMLLFYDVAKPTLWLLLPYLLWVTFAGYLNFAIYLLN